MNLRSGGSPVKSGSAYRLEGSRGLLEGRGGLNYLHAYPQGTAQEGHAGDPATLVLRSQEGGWTKVVAASD
jgi:hypothetical protein